MPLTHQDINIRRNWKSLLCHQSALTLLLSTSLQKSGSTFPSTTCIRAHCNVPQDQPAHCDIKLRIGAGISPGAESQLAHLKWFPAQGKWERSVWKDLVCRDFPNVSSPPLEKKKYWLGWGPTDGVDCLRCTGGMILSLLGTGLGWAGLSSPHSIAGEFAQT